jgi:uncharacterized membrane protein
MERIAVAIEKQKALGLGEAGRAASVRLPVTSAEIVNALSHYYRGEVSRMMSWRERLDLTTNWAIGAVAAMLSITFSSPSSHHATLLLAMLVVFMLLVIESRRYRFFCVYRNRVRLFERQYFSQLLAPRDVVDDQQWAVELGEDLRVPRFPVPLSQAMARRLRRTYFWIFLILLLSWLLKTSVIVYPLGGEATYARSVSELLRNAAIAGLPGWAVIAAVAGFYGYLLYVMVRHNISPRELTQSHVQV